MLFNYLNIVFEVAAHVFRALGACAVLLPFAYFIGTLAIDMCNGLSVVLGLMAVASIVMAAAAVYLEADMMMDEIRAFRRWRAFVQNV